MGKTRNEYEEILQVAEVTPQTVTVVCWNDTDRGHVLHGLARAAHHMEIEIDELDGLMTEPLIPFRLPQGDGTYRLITVVSWKNFMFGPGSKMGHRGHPWGPVFLTPLLKELDPGACEVIATLCDGVEVQT